MSSPQVPGKPPVFSASAVLNAIGEALSAIKSSDRLTFSDLGAVLGRSEDQAARYCDGTATMDAITFHRAKREWGGRFTGGVDRLCADARPHIVDDRAHGSSILRAALALSEALEDGEISAREVRAHRGTLENARDAIEAQLAKLAPARITA